MMGNNNKSRVQFPALYQQIATQNHTIIAGASGSGKSVVINGLILYLLQQDIKLYLIDPKKVELSRYRRHRKTAVYTDTASGTISALKKAVIEMDKRYKYMQLAGQRKTDKKHIYIIIDEFADLITTHKKQVEPLIIRLSQLGRAAGVHLIIATQRPTAEIINKRITVNIDARLALRCGCRQDSINIIGCSGAELLPKYGQGIYKDCEYYKPETVTIPLYTDEIIQSII